jgi:hypothetical protein
MMAKDPKAARALLVKVLEDGQIGSPKITFRHACAIHRNTINLVPSKSTRLRRTIEIFRQRTIEILMFVVESAHQYPHYTSLRHRDASLSETTRYRASAH